MHQIRCFSSLLKLTFAVQLGGRYIAVPHQLESSVSGSDTPGQPVGDSGIATTAGLNGAQITAALNILNELKTGSISPEQALALLLSMGIDEDKAKRIINKG